MLQPLQLLFGFAIVAWVLHSVSFRVGREGLEANIKADSFLCCNMLNVPISLYAKLNEVAVGTADNANPFDLLEREGFNRLVPDEAQASNATTISEGDVFAVGFQLPARLLVLHAAIIVLELGIAFLSRLVCLAVLREPSNSEPGTISRGLTSLGVQVGGFGVLFSENGTIALQVILANATLIHPFAQTLIANELNNPYCLIYRSILR